MTDRSSPPEDRLFDAFRRTGRPEHLAEVFDRTAPELLRVALHLTGDPAEAEDAVQATFLAAIETRDRYDAGRPLLPWLIGILTNQARTARRRRQTPPPRTAPRPAPDPAAHAEGLEFTRALDDAILGLPIQYQPVLVLHLRHGLAPAEIAAALRRSPGTVRSQLMRGLAQLRRSLPIGFTASAALFAGPVRGLDAVRRTVLEQAAVTTAAASPLLGGFLAMKKLTLIAVAVALALWTALAFARPWTAAQGPAEAAAVTAAETTVSLAAPRTESEGETTPARAAHETPRDPPAAATAALTVTVEWRGAAPAGGVRVLVVEETRADPLLRAHSGVTDPAGRVRFAGLLPGEVDVRLDRAAARTVRLTGAETHCRIELDPARELRGRVVDSGGRGIAGAEVWITPDGRADRLVGAARTDPDGRFEVHGMDPAYFLSARADGFVPCAPLRATDGEIELALTPTGAILTGRVTDGRGRPVAGALVRLGNEYPPFQLLDAGGRPSQFVTNKPPVTVRTDASGCYRCASVAAGEMTVFARAPGFAGSQTRATLIEGTTNRHDIELDAGCRLVCFVTDSAGQPCAGATVRCAPGPRRTAAATPEWFLAQGRTGSDGRVLLDGMPIAQVRVEAEAGAAGRIDAEISLVADAINRWDARLDPGPTIAGVVVDTDGRPLPGRQVTARADGTAGPVRTDGTGRFALTGLDGAQRYEVVVAADRGLLGLGLARRADVRPDDGPLRIVCDPDAVAQSRLAIEVAGPDARPDPTAQVVLHRITPGETPGATSSARLAVDPDSGVLRSAPFPPGEYDVTVESRHHVPHDFGRVAFAPGVRDLGRVALQAGGYLAARFAFADGKVPGSLWVDFVDGPADITDVLLTQGRLRRGPVPPGRYRLAVRGSGVALQRVELDVRAGAGAERLVRVESGYEVELVLHGLGSKRPRCATLALLDEPGVDDSYLFADRDGENPSIHRRFVAGRYRFRVRGTSGATAEFALEVGEGKDTVHHVWLR